MLVRVTSNIAKEMAKVHSTGCIIGDINQSGVLISEDATVVLIDTDSFQYSHNGTVFRCKVGVPEFTPPELQGKDLSLSVRTFNHDYFGLAVLIFYTLMMGRHPFVGRYLGPGDMPPIDRLIADYRFAYSARRSSTLMDPPPNVPTLADLPISVGDAFERAFGPGGATARVSATEWAAILDKAEGEIVQCTSVSAHHYFRSAKSCPWCRMERASPGFQAFVPVFPVKTGDKPLDLGELIAAVRAVKDPGPAPDLVAMMPSVAVVKPPIWAEIKKARIRRWMAATVGAAIALFCLIAPPLSQAPIFGLLALSLSIAAAARSPPQLKVEREKLGRAEAAWNDAKTAFEQAAGNGFFAHLRQEADPLISQLNETNAEETRRLADLANRKRELQLRHYLDRHHIDQTKIKGIGSARKITLKSFGIETAADVERSKILAISGFGPATADTLQDWRRRLEASFHFDPNRAIDPADVAAIKAEIANRRADLAGRVRQTIARLEKASLDASALRSNPGNQAIDAWTAWKSAEQFERELRPSGLEVGQLIGVGAICLAAVSISVGLEHSPITPSGPRVQGKATDFAPRQSGGDHETGTLLATPPQSPTGPGASDKPVTPEAPRPSVPGSEATRNVPAGQSTEPKIDRSTGATSPPSTSAPAPRQAPLDAKTAPGVELSTKRGSLDLLDRSNATRVQDRLRALGYTQETPDEIWGARSRAALRDFRRVRGLGGDDTWDAATETALMSADAPRAGTRPMVPAIEVESTFSLPSGAMHNPLNQPDARWLQERLREEGFYSGNIDGIWGLSSRAALQAFKAQSGLPANDVWDAVTEARLSGLGPAQTTQTFEGG